MRFRVDPGSPLPIYGQLVEQIRRAIGSGVLRPGDRLPGIRELAESEAIHPMTVVRAYNELIEEGLLVGLQGRGTFVVEQEGAQLSARERRRAARRIAEELVVKALQLGLSREEILEAVAEAHARVDGGADGGADTRGRS